MRYSHEAMEKETTHDRKALLKVEKAIESIKSVKIDEIEKRYEAVKAKIGKLQGEKHEMMRAPMTKQELLDLAKEQLRLNRENAIDNVLVSHFKDCHTGRGFPLTPEVMGRACEDYKLSNLVFLALSEKHLEDAVAQLDDIGIPASEREAKINEINKEIERLSIIAEKDLASLNKQ